MANPVVYDVDRDGHFDILVTTDNAELVFLKYFYYISLLNFLSNHGLPLYNYTLKVPPIPIEKNWYAGLDGGDIVASMNLFDSPPSGRKLLQFNERPAPP